MTKHIAKKVVQQDLKDNQYLLKWDYKKSTLLAGHNIKDKFIGGVHTLATNGGEVVN